MDNHSDDFWHWFYSKSNKPKNGEIIISEHQERAWQARADLVQRDELDVS